MLIRLGYVAIALNLKDASTSKSLTLTSFQKLANEEAKMFKLRKVSEENLNNLLRVLRYNVAYNIKVYRITSKLFPLATHPLLEGWDYIGEFKDKLKEIGDYIKENDIRISAHPDHFTVINSNNEKVFESSVKDLEYHNKIFNSMGLNSDYKLVLHVGGLYKDKEGSIDRFIEGFNKLPNEIAHRIIVENDDKIYNIEDVLRICKAINRPMVLDVHHHNCNNSGEPLENLLKDIFNTWNNEKFVPKIHFSSPKDEKEFRSHADNINIDEFVEFLKISKKLDRDYDVMLEAKNKDIALLKLNTELKSIPAVKVIDEGHLQY